MSIPEYLYHKTSRKNVESILEYGLVPKVPDEWRYLIPVRYRNRAIVWLKENPNGMSVCTSMLDRSKLHRLKLKDKRIRWWFYIDVIPPEALVT